MRRIRRGLLYLSSHLKQRGFKVGVFDSTFRTIEDFATCSIASSRPSSASPST